MLPTYDFASFEHCKKLKELGVGRKLRPMVGVYALPLPYENDNELPYCLCIFEGWLSTRGISVPSVAVGSDETGPFVCDPENIIPAFSFGELSRITGWISDNTDYEASDALIESKSAVLEKLQAAGDQGLPPLPAEELIDIYHPNFLADILLDALYQKAVTPNQINALLNDPALLAAPLQESWPPFEGKNISNPLLNITFSKK